MCCITGKGTPNLDWICYVTIFERCTICVSISQNINSIISLEYCYFKVIPFKRDIQSTVSFKGSIFNSHVNIDDYFNCDFESCTFKKQKSTKQ